MKPMSYVNGTAHQEPSAPPPNTAIAPTDGTVGTQLSPERLQKIRELLSEPFDPGEIKWRVTATSTQQTKHGPQKRGQLVAYADQRAYTDRLNEVFGEWGWTRNYDVQVAQNFERRAPGDKKQTAVSAKVVVVSTVTIHGLGSHTGVGEEWADDENAATRAEAQAFKRACACFGLGRYLYDLDKVWSDLDQYNRPFQTPNLPDWALPGYAQREAQRQAERRAFNQQRQGLVREELLGKIGELRTKVGHSLSRFVFHKYAGDAPPEELGHAKLTLVFDKLMDIGNGIDRLRKASNVIGDARYSSICREMNFASESIDDIPDRDALRQLLTRVEAEASQSSGASQVSIADARGHLLQAARKVAEKTGRRLADVIAEASEGKLALDGLSKLTDAEVAVVSSATARLRDWR
ncbi:MAG TPA: Rad52/Rad22 family DNA repair protein [Terriglobales bacterium]|nr:Rad52/Rad22 family DNA repair protein [Terriglobales bacterium]